MVYPWRFVRDQDNAHPDLRTLTVNVTNTTPPAFLAQAENDGAHVENSVEYFLALKDAALPGVTITGGDDQHRQNAELHAFPCCGHGYGMCKVPAAFQHPDWEVCTWPARAEAFLARQGMRNASAASA